jgi:hypothetical protein
MGRRTGTALAIAVIDDAQALLQRLEALDRFPG